MGGAAEPGKGNCGMFKTGDFVRLKDDPSRGGMITGINAISRNRRYWEVMLADGTGTTKFAESQLEAATSRIDPLEELAQGRFTDPDRLRRSILHHRLTGRLRDMIYSIDATDTDFHAYQFKPVVKLLASPSQGLLIADEVGLGKTIEAGLVWTELVARFDASRLLVICPKSLTEKWRMELRQKFSVDARIVDARGLLDALRDDGETGEGFALVASLSAVRPPKDWEDDDKSVRAALCRHLSDSESNPRPLFDCVIFDEAHHLRNRDTQAHTFARTAMRVADYKLLLSATPINLRSEDLQTLLALLDPDTFDSEYAFSVLNEENRPLVQARDLVLNQCTPFADLVQTLRTIPRGDMLKIERQLDNLQRELAQPGLKDGHDLRVRIAAMLEEMSLLGTIVNRTRRRDVNDLQVKREVDDLRWDMTDEERSFYDAVSDVVRQHAFELDASERFLLATPQRLIASSLAAAFAHWASLTPNYSEDEEDEEDNRRRGRAGPLSAKLAELCQSSNYGLALELDDTKYATLRNAIAQHGARGDDKLIVFSTFRTTLDYLARRLRADGVEIEVMHGGIKDDRSTIVARFAERSGSCVLLTSEVGGEGLDMQFCRALINYDLPWNPMKVEQRIGRIDRIGQTAERINVLSLIARNTIEERIYDRLYLRLLTIQQTLGAFEAVLGNEISDLEARLLDPRLTSNEKETEIERSAMALINRQKQIEKLEEEAPGLIAHGNMILAQIEANRRPERRIEATELADYVHEALAGRFPGSRVADVPGNPGLFEVVLSESAQLAMKRVTARSGRARTSLNRENRILAAFEKRRGLPKRTEIISSVHPLVRLAASIREESVQGASADPVISVQASARDLPGVPAGCYVAAVARWSIEGAIRIDRLFYCASSVGGPALEPVDAERLVQLALRTAGHKDPAVPLEAVAAASRELIDAVMEPAFDDFLEEENARHEDRADTSLARIERQEEKRTRETKAKLYEWKHSGDAKKLRMVSAEQGKLDKLIARLEERKSILRSARARFSHNNVIVGMLVINLV